MDMSWIWKAILIVVGGTLLLRISGRKTISQMTLAETIIMISIGTLLIQPVATKNVWLALATGVVLVLTLMVMGYGQVKIDWLEHLITGQSKLIIENGKLKEENLKKLRLTVDQLESRLRQHNVTHIGDVEWATMEPSGQIGFTLKPEAQPATKKDLQQLQQSLAQLGQLNQQVNLPQQQLNQNNLFKEVAYNEHKHAPPEHLQ